MEIEEAEVVLCKFYFSDLNTFKNRPVLVFKNNLPYSDFIAIPISSKVNKMHEDEFLITHEDFSEGDIPKTSKLILRKTFVVSKEIVTKKYGKLKKESFAKFSSLFCQYFKCT